MSERFFQKRKQSYSKKFRLIDFAVGFGIGLFFMLLSIIELTNDNLVSISIYSVLFLLLIIAGFIVKRHFISIGLIVVLVIPFIIISIIVGRCTIL